MNLQQEFRMLLLDNIQWHGDATKADKDYSNASNQCSQLSKDIAVAFGRFVDEYVLCNMKEMRWEVFNDEDENTCERFETLDAVFDYFIIKIYKP